MIDGIAAAEDRPPIMRFNGDATQLPAVLPELQKRLAAHPA